MMIGLSLLASACVVSGETSSLIVDEHFESTDMAASGDWQTDSKDQGFIEPECSIEGHQAAGAGCPGYAALFKVKPCSSGDCFRSELKKHYPNNFIEGGKEYWFGLSFMVPASAEVKDSNDDVNIYHMQIHGDSSSDCKSLGERNLTTEASTYTGAPNFGLQIHNKGPPFKHQFQWIGSDDVTHKETLQGDVKLGSYEDFVLNVKFEHSETGFFHLYRNGEHVLSKTDISTMYTSKKGCEPYLKIGAYVNKPFKDNGDPKTKEWEVYYRAVKVAEGSSKLNDVDTTCQNTPEPTPKPTPSPVPACSDSSDWIQDAYYAGEDNVVPAIEDVMPSECCAACEAEVLCGSWTVAFLDSTALVRGKCHLAAPGDGSIISEVENHHSSGLKTSTPSPSPTPSPTPAPTPSPTPAPTPSPSPSGDSPRVVISPELGWSLKAWGWDDGGKDSYSKHKVIDVDLDDDKDRIPGYVADGHIVICYFSVGTLEAWRPDCDGDDAKHCSHNADKWKEVLAGQMDDWDEAWLDIGKLDKLKELMTPRFQKAREYGCHGVEPDNIDCWQSDDCDASSKSKSTQIAFNKWQTDLAHSLGLSIGMKNAVDIVDDMEEYYDFAVNEGCYKYEECDKYERFLSHGKAAFAVNYGTSSSHCSDLCNCAKDDGLQLKYCDGSSGLCKTGSWTNCFNEEDPLPSTECTSGSYEDGQCVGSTLAMV